MTDSTPPAPNTPAIADLLDPALRHTVATDPAGFRPYDRYGTAIPGLTWLPLTPGVAAGGPGLWLLRFAPGARSMPHQHTGREEFLVMEGTLIDCDGQALPAGTFVSYAAGSRHHSAAPDGCLLLVSLREPNQPL